MTDIIILLNGNHCPLRSEDKDVANFLKYIKDAMRRAIDDPAHYMEVGTTMLLSKNILGFYTRPVVETAADKAVRLLEKAAESTQEGDEWKGQ